MTGPTVTTAFEVRNGGRIARVTLDNARRANCLSQALVEQVKDGGRIVAPIGDEQGQELMLYTKRGKRLRPKRMGDCFFVPLIGKYGVAEGQ